MKTFFPPSFCFLDDIADINNKRTLCRFICSNIEGSSWKWRNGFFSEEEGLGEETLRKYMNIFKVFYKFLYFSLHQSRYKWESYIVVGKKNTTGLYLWIGSVELFFQLKACSEHKLKEKRNKSVPAFLFIKALVTGSYSVYWIRKGHPRLVHGEVEFHLCVHRVSHLHDIVLVL